MIVVVILPPVFVALIVYVVVALTTVGVPDISPVAVSNRRPAGSAGAVSYTHLTLPTILLV